MKPPQLYANALRRNLRSRGFGIHSPFAFHFVTRVLSERLPYYAYEDIAMVRSLALEAAAAAGRRHPHIMSLKNARMLFRVVCHFKPRTIFQIGTHFGLASYAALAADSRSHLVLYAPDNPHSHIFSLVTEPMASRIDAQTDVNIFEKMLMDQTAEPIFLMISSLSIDDRQRLEDLIVELSSTRPCIIAVRNLTQGSHGTIHLWRRLLEERPYGMAFTNGNIGFVTALPHLPKQHFSLWF